MKRKIPPLPVVSYSHLTYSFHLNHVKLCFRMTGQFFSLITSCCLLAFSNLFYDFVVVNIPESLHL